MSSLYKAGAKGYFDSVGVHPFTNALLRARTASQTARHRPPRPQGDEQAP